MLNKRKHTGSLPFWIISIGLLIILTLPALVKDGMFMDAMLYTCVAHNLSEGIGTFWFPRFSYLNMSGLTSFHEQPPLGFEIQSWFFKIFGDGMYTERIYTFLTLCIAALLIVLLWKEVYKEDEYSRKNGWLPLILFIIIPQCYWSYSNNVLEDTMVIFILLSTLYSYKSCRSGKMNFFYLALSGLFLFFATLTKGLPGLFPVVLPFIYWLTIGNISRRRMIASTLILILVPALIYGALMLYPDSKESLGLYVTKRLLERIYNEPVVANRLVIAGELFLNLLPPLLVTFIIMYIAKLKSLLPERKEFRGALFFILLGFSGSLPLLATRVQREMYLTPSFPFFAIGLSISSCRFMVNKLSKINVKNKSYKVLLMVSILFLLFSITYTLFQIGKTGRNKEMLHDVYIIGKTVPKYSVISIPNNGDMWNDWELQCYLMRYFNISLDPQALHKYYLDKVEYHSPPPASYVLNQQLLRYCLYSKDTINSN